MRRGFDLVRRVPLVGLMVASCLAGPGARSDTSETTPASPAPMGPADGPVPADPRAAGGALDREAVLGTFLSEHWRLPVPIQGHPPSGFSDLEASLSPEACGSCHPEQHRQWRDSLHAAAFSPGFAGQLLQGSLAAPGQVRSCQTCHAPLEEQQPYTPEGAPAPAERYDPELRAQGIVCASCHVRAHQRYGPPRRKEGPPSEERLPHRGFEPRPEFQEARFCATCHQFWNDPGVNGKPIQNTFAEWRASRHADEGRTCQSCHMPDRAHLWRGIHDPEMVRQAVDVRLTEPRMQDGRVRADLELHNRGVGHAFPTYVTPRVFLEVWQEDASGEALQSSRREAVVGREVDFRRGTESFDTRILPGERFTLEYEARKAEGARRLVARVVVDPDHHYRGLFAALGGSYTDPEALALIEEAHRRTKESAYTLSTKRRPLP